MPDSSATHRLNYLSLAIAASALAPFVALDPDPRHDGLMHSTALAVAQGRTLYSDIFSTYPPATHWVQAGVIWLFGDELIFQRFLAWLIVLASTLLLYKLAWELTKSICLSLIVGLTVLLGSPVSVKFWPIYLWPSQLLTFIFLTVLLLETIVSKRRIQLPIIFLSGLLIGMTPFVRFFSGSFAVVAFLVYSTAGGFDRNEKGMRVVAVLMGMLFPLGYLSLNGQLGSMVSQVGGETGAAYGGSFPVLALNFAASVVARGSMYSMPCAAVYFFSKRVVNVSLSATRCRLADKFLGPKKTQLIISLGILIILFSNPWLVRIVTKVSIISAPIWGYMMTKGSLRPDSPLTMRNREKALRQKKFVVIAAPTALVLSLWLLSAAPSLGNGERWEKLDRLLEARFYVFPREVGWRSLPHDLLVSLTAAAVITIFGSFAAMRSWRAAKPIDRLASLKSLLIPALAAACLLETIHSPDPAHLWWASPVLALMISYSLPNRVKIAVTPLIALAFLSASIGMIDNIREERIVLKDSYSLTGMAVRASSFRGWHDAIDILEAIDSDKQVAFNCNEALFASATGDFLPTDGTFLQWARDLRPSAVEALDNGDKLEIFCPQSNSRNSVQWDYGGYSLPSFEIEVFNMVEN